MRGAKKSEHNPCPICVLPRGKGPHEFAHGKCMEKRAKTDGKKSAGLPGQLSRLTVDHVANAKHRRAVKNTEQFQKWLERHLTPGTEYDFDTEKELVKQCQCDECIHMDIEPRRRPPEIEYAD